MREPWRHRLLRTALAVWFLAAAQALPGQITHCDVCGLRPGGMVYRGTDKLTKQDYWACETCARRPDACAVCDRRLGIKGRRALPDGRLYCERDWPALVNDPREAERLFHETRRAVATLLRHWGEVPADHLTFTLVDKDEFLRQYRRSPSPHNPDTVMGLTRSRPGKEGRFEHDIFVLNGLRRESFMAACAHEITHAWLAEHQKKPRAVHDDTLEGFCELIAWKVMDGLHAAFEKEQIEQNTYTRGQLLVLRAAEDAHRFYRVVDWMLGGVDGWLEPDKLDRVYVLRDDRTGRPASTASTVAPTGPWALPAAAPQPAPQRLMLRGVMGTPGGGRAALINDALLTTNQAARVRVGATNVHVRCLEIRAEAVVVEVDGAGRQELTLPGK